MERALIFALTCLREECNRALVQLEDNQYPDPELEEAVYLVGLLLDTLEPDDVTRS